MADEERGDLLHELVRGRLPPDQAAQLNSAIEADPQLKAEHRLVEKLNETGEAAGQFPGELGWARLSRTIDREGRQGLWDRRVRVWQAAACLVVAVGTWQFAVAPQLTPSADQPARFQTATGPVSTADAAVTARVIFAPAATAEAIATLLRETDASIVDGPNALGFFTIGFESDEARDAALSQFATAPNVIELTDPQ